ncbi:hypothetical protein ABFV70_04085 [Staphylococcus arlettae]
MMQRNNNFNEYPKILKIEDDGTIIALDKHGKVNTDLNTHSVTDEQQYNILEKYYTALIVVSKNTNNPMRMIHMIRTT